MVIRTRLVELSSLDAVAYRQKLRGGQSGVVILRPDTAQPGLALLNHQSGQPDPAANNPCRPLPAGGVPGGPGAHLRVALQQPWPGAFAGGGARGPGSSRR